MFRKSLFWGLTLMLAAVLVVLVVKGRKAERMQQAASRPVEVVRTSPPSLTRVISPNDLQIVESKMDLEAPEAQPGQDAPSPGRTARHHLVIRDDGAISYRSFGLKVAYIGRENKVIETRTVPVPELLQPGQARSISEVKVENVPSGTVKCEVKVAYADIEPTTEKPKTEPTPAK